MVWNHQLVKLNCWWLVFFVGHITIANQLILGSLRSWGYLKSWTRIGSDLDNLAHIYIYICWFIQRSMICLYSIYISISKCACTYYFLSTPCIILSKGRFFRKNLALMPPCNSKVAKNNFPHQADGEIRQLKCPADSDLFHFSRTALGSGTFMGHQILFLYEMILYDIVAYIVWYCMVLHYM